MGHVCALLFLLVANAVNDAAGGGAPALKHPPCKAMLANGAPVEVEITQSRNGVVQTESIEENSISKSTKTWDCARFTYTFKYGSITYTRHGKFPVGGFSGSVDLFVSNIDEGRLDVGCRFEEFPLPSDADNTNDDSAFIIFVNLLHYGKSSDTVRLGPSILLPPFKAGGESLIPGKGDDQYVKQDSTKLGIKLVDEKNATSSKDLTWTREVGESEIAMAFVMGTPDKMYLRWHMVRDSDILDKALHELPFFHGPIPWVIFVGVTLIGPILYFLIVNLRARSSNPMKDDPLGQLVLAEDESGSDGD